MFLIIKMTIASLLQLARLVPLDNGARRQRIRHVMLEVQVLRFLRFKPKIRRDSYQSDL